MWKSIIVIKPDIAWKFTPEVEGKYFRLRHINPPRSPLGWISQVEPIPNTNFHIFFQPQRINGLSVFELLELNKPLIFESRKLAFRQEYKALNDWLIEIEVFTMPVIDLTPDQPVINPAIATVKVPTSVPIGPAANTAVRLLSVNSTSARKHATFYNPSTTRNLYIDTDSTVSMASAVAKVAPGKVYVSDFPSWQGEYWALLDGTGTTAVSVAVEEYM